MIRFATPADASALLDIYTPYVETTAISFETEAPSPEEFAGRVKDISAFFPYLVVEEDGEILGYAYAHPFHERKAYSWTVETSIYVRQNARGKQIGRRLYKALLPLLEMQNVRNACAVVTIPNDPSIGFHRAMGFIEGGFFPNFGYKFGQWKSVSYLYLTFGEPGSDPLPLISVHDLDKAQVSAILREET